MLRLQLYMERAHRHMDVKLRPLYSARFHQDECEDFIGRMVAFILAAVDLPLWRT